jgi:hypothetical protein
MTTKKKEFKFLNGVSLYFDGIVDSFAVDNDGCLNELVLKGGKVNYQELLAMKSFDPKHSSYQVPITTEASQFLLVGSSEELNANLMDYDQNTDHFLLKTLASRIGQRTRVRFYGEFQEVASSEIPFQEFVILSVQFFNDLDLIKK